MSGKSACAAPRAPAPRPEKSPDKSKPSALAQPNPPNPRAEQPAPHAAGNPANNCTPCPQKANSEIAASTPAPHPSAAPHPPADPPAAHTHPKEDTAPAAEYAGCSKGSPPSNSPKQYSMIPAKTKTESAPPNPSASDHSRQRQIPSDKESTPRKAPEFPDQVFHWRIAPDQAGTAQYQKQKRVPQFSNPEQPPEFPAPPRARIASDSQNSRHTSLPAYAPQEIHAPNNHGNVSHQQNQNPVPKRCAQRDKNPQ